MTSFEKIGAAPVSTSAREHMVRMRDGVRLATDLYLPAPEDIRVPGPTILVRLPYDKSSPLCNLPGIAEYMTRRGYRVVVQDVRGKFRSEGTPLVSVNESADGYDTIEWVTQQEWSNGRVAMWGDSYYGFTQWAAAGTGHPALRAISPRVTGRELAWLPVDNPDGVTREVEWSEHRLYATTFFVDEGLYDWRMDWSRRPYVDAVEEFFASAGTRSDSWDLWAPPHPVKLRRFPEGDPLDAPAIPTLITIGWWDVCAPWGWKDWFEAQARGGWGLNSFLYVDSIDHLGNHLLGEYEGEQRTAQEWAAVIPSLVDPALDFFDVFVRDEGTAASVPKVRWNLAHTEGMREDTTWPPAAAAGRTLHATAGGRLAPEPDAEESALTWTHDPDDLVPGPIPRESLLGFVRLMPDENVIGERDDVLVFAEQPVGSDVDLVGGVALKGRFASSGPAMDVIVRLLDRSPDGSLHLITRGGVTIPEVGSGRDITVDLGQVGYRLRAGHSLVLFVASSNFPEFMPQTGTGEDPWLAIDVERNEQTTIVGGTRGLRLDIHELPA